MVALTFSHIGITVPDLEKAVEFYSKAFGLYVIMGPTEVQHDDSAIGQMCDDVFGEGWGSFRIAHLSMGDGVGIELFEFPDTIEEERPFEYWRRGLFHFCVQDPDIEALTQKSHNPTSFEDKVKVKVPKGDLVTFLASFMQEGMELISIEPERLSLEDFFMGFVTSARQE